MPTGDYEWLKWISPSANPNYSYNVSGSSNNIPLTPHEIAYSAYMNLDYTEPKKVSLDDISIDALWEKMYTKAVSIWFSCPYCDSANAVGNSVCCQCGGPLGSEHEAKSRIKNL